MADDETKQEPPKTTDEDADQEDVEGHNFRHGGQRPDGESGEPNVSEAGRPTPQNRPPI